MSKVEMLVSVSKMKKNKRTTLGDSSEMAVKYGLMTDWYTVDIVVGLAVLRVPKSEPFVPRLPLGDVEEVAVEIIKWWRMSLLDVEQVECSSARNRRKKIVRRKERKRIDARTCCAAITGPNVTAVHAWLQRELQRHRLIAGIEFQVWSNPRRQKSFDLI